MYCTLQRLLASVVVSSCITILHSPTIMVANCAKAVRGNDSLVSLLSIMGIVSLGWTIILESWLEASYPRQHDFPVTAAVPSILFESSRKREEVFKKREASNVMPLEKEGSDNLNRNDNDEEDVFGDKEHFVNILKRYGVVLPIETLRKIPKWSFINDLYGSSPVIYGLDRCQEFRDSVSEGDRFTGGAGLFNTGTNLLAELLRGNCAIPSRTVPSDSRLKRGMAWSVNWGKHIPAEFRLNYTVEVEYLAELPKQNILPVVMIRNPYTWMSSMCKKSYSLNWNHARVCPHLFDVKKNKTVEARYNSGVSVIKQETIAHVWNSWNNGYFSKADYPFLMIRIEDLIFYPEEAVKEVCSCVGGEMVSETFKYVLESAKTGPGHGREERKTDLVNAWIKYGKVPDVNTFPPVDLAFAREALDKKLMETFGYNFIS